MSEIASLALAMTVNATFAMTVKVALAMTLLIVIARERSDRGNL